MLAISCGVLFQLTYPFQFIQHIKSMFFKTNPIQMSIWQNNTQVSHDETHYFTSLFNYIRTLI